MASGILSVQRGLGSTAGFAIMGSVLAIVVSTQLPAKLETIVPDPTERTAVVDEISGDANPQAVPAIIGPAPSDLSATAQRDDVVAAADSVFTNGIALAEAVGFVLVVGAFGFGWKNFPRVAGVEESEEDAEADLLGS